MLPHLSKLAVSLRIVGYIQSFSLIRRLRKIGAEVAAANSSDLRVQ